MNYEIINYSTLSTYTKKLFNKINKNYDYDLVIFVAKGGYLIGRDIASFKNVPLLEIKATRSNNKIKRILKPIVKLIPNKLLLWLRKKEIKSNKHVKHSERKISYDINIWTKYKDSKNILIVDDSVDTGNSIKQVKEAVKVFFKESNIKVVSINVFDQSKSVIKTDYTLFNNYIVKGPWSTDSNEYSRFIKDYNRWHEGQGE